MQLILINLTGYDNSFFDEGMLSYSNIHYGGTWLFFIYKFLLIYCCRYKCRKEIFVICKLLILFFRICSVLCNQFTLSIVYYLKKNIFCLDSIMRIFKYPIFNIFYLILQDISILLPGLKVVFANFPQDFIALRVLIPQDPNQIWRNITLFTLEKSLTLVCIAIKDLAEKRA